MITGIKKLLQQADRIIWGPWLIFLLQFPTMYGWTVCADRICIRRTGRAVTIAG